MGLPANTVVEVRSTGNDNNGGGFVTGSSGTDYSQQNSAQFSGTDLASTNGTTNPSVVSSASHNFVAADVGNLIQITAGTNWNPGFYQIVSVSSNKATLDRQCGSTATLTGGTWAEGGALATPTKALSNSNFIGGGPYTGDQNTTGIIIYIKASATYQITSTITITGSADNVSGVTRIVGYSTTRGDKGQAHIQTNAGSINLLTFSTGNTNALYSFENIIWDGNNKTASAGLLINVAGINIAFANCIFENFTGSYVVRFENVPHVNMFTNCDFLNNAFTTTDSYIVTNGNGIFEACYFAGNSNTSANVGACIDCDVVMIENCIFYDNTGSAFDCIFEARTGVIRNCIFHDNGGDAINNSSIPVSSSIGALYIANNIFTDNTGWAIDYSGFSPSPTLVGILNNAYYNNTAGNQNGYTGGGGDVTLTGLPYNNAPTDFGLNYIGGEGAACRGAGVPGTIGSASVVGTGYLDIGALQHQCVTGSGGMIGDWFGV